MARRLTCGFEDRTDHPQLVGWAEGHDSAGSPHFHYLAGGVEGSGFVQLDNEGWAAGSRYAWVRLDYSIVAANELFIWLHMKPESTCGNREETHCRIIWDNSASPDPGYFDLSAHGDFIAWSWSGTTQSIPMTINDGDWYSVAIHVKVDPAGNEVVQIWLDGFLQFDYSGELTVAFSEMDRISLYGYVRGSGLWPRPHPLDGFDNLMVNDASGAIDKAIPWGRYLLALPVNGPGAYAELVPRPGPPNWDCVEERPPDDNNWVEQYDPGFKDSYAFTNTPATVAGQDDYLIHRVILRGRHSVDGEEEFPVGFRPFVRNGGDQAGSFKESLADPESFEESWAVNPSTGNPWERNEVDALEAGVEVV